MGVGVFECVDAVLEGFRDGQCPVSPLLDGFVHRSNVADVASQRLSRRPQLSDVVLERFDVGGQRIHTLGTGGSLRECREVTLALGQRPLDGLDALSEILHGPLWARHPS